LALLVIAGPITRPLAAWPAIAMTVLAATVLLSTLLFQRELESRTYPVSFVALRHDGGELEDKSIGIRYYPAFLHGLDHRLAYRTGFWGALGMSAVLLLLGATGIRHAVWHPHVETGSEGCQATDPPLTSLRFCVTAEQDIGPQVAFHFSGLGYRLVDEQPNAWVFQRGRRFAGFWTSPFCTDIRAYDTTLTVNATPGKKGELLVSCVWAVRTWGAWFGRREIRQLEAEGGELKSLLGGGDDRILSDSESITPPWYSVAAIIGAVLSVVILSVAVIGYVVISQDQNWLSISNKSLGDPIADEASKLQGRWKVVEAEDSEKKAPAEVLKLMSFVFEGDRLTFEYGELSASFKIDPTKKVKEIDLTVLAGSEKGEVLHGIYTLDGDHLKLCFSLDSNKTRPCEFKAGKDNRALLYVLQRDGQ
jgi:uncharacterized protein (TIGR03067 family)